MHLLNPFFITIIFLRNCGSCFPVPVIFKTIDQSKAAVIALIVVVAG